jgi:hypothetical protein
MSSPGKPSWRRILMKKHALVLLLLLILLAACEPAATPAPSETATQTRAPTSTETLTPTPEPTSTPTLTPTPNGIGPENFPAGVNPLTGLKVAVPSLLERRPMLIKVANLPRHVRPQWGLSLADLVFEYYTEEGTTRFAAIFYGNNAETVGPIRSGRFIDAHLVRSYKAIFAFGYADPTEMVPFQNSDFADRMVVNDPYGPMKWYDPKTMEFLTVGTAALSSYASKKGIENGRQDLSGMFFKVETPTGGQPAAQTFVRYSASVYNRWDYDAASGKYVRFCDNADVYGATEREWYVPLTDRLTNEPIAFENVVILFVNHKLHSPGIYDIDLIGSGKGYALRDGQIYPVKWYTDAVTVVSLENADGTPFASKPGTTWFEVVGLNTTTTQTDQSWRFVHLMP